MDILEDFKAVSNMATTENMVLQWKKLFATSSTKKKILVTTPNMRQTKTVSTFVEQSPKEVLQKQL